MFSLEMDVFAPPGIITFMIERMGSAEYILHGYPNRIEKNGVMLSFGCALFKRSVLEKIDFGGWGKVDPEAPDLAYTSDGWILTKMMKAGIPAEYAITDRLPIQHLEEGEQWKR